MPGNTFSVGDDRRSATSQEHKPLDCLVTVRKTKRKDADNAVFTNPNRKEHKQSARRDVDMTVTQAPTTTKILTPPPTDTTQPWTCLRCQKSGLVEVASKTPSYSNVAAKRAHRRWAIASVAAHPAKHPAVLYLDDELPFENNTSGGSYFTDDLLAALPDRVLPNQCFSANVKPEVVRDLQARGLVHVHLGCVCILLQRYASVIRGRTASPTPTACGDTARVPDYYGGLVLAFLDVFGGYETGARPLLEMSVSLRLLEPRGCMLTFAASDRAARVQGKTCLSTRVKIERDAQRLMREAMHLEEILEMPEDMPVSYETEVHLQLQLYCCYRTMQVYGWRAIPIPKQL